MSISVEFWGFLESQRPWRKLSGRFNQLIFIASAICQIVKDTELNSFQERISFKLNDKCLYFTEVNLKVCRESRLQSGYPADSGFDFLTYMIQTFKKKARLRQKITSFGVRHELVGQVVISTRKPWLQFHHRRQTETESHSSKSNRHRVTGRTKIDLRIPNFDSCFSKMPEILNYWKKKNFRCCLRVAVRRLFKVCREAEKSLGARQLQGMCISPFKLPAFVEGCAYTLKNPIVADREIIFLTRALKSLPRLSFFLVFFRVSN